MKLFFLSTAISTPGCRDIFLWFVGLWDDGDEEQRKWARLINGAISSAAERESFHAVLYNGCLSGIRQLLFIPSAWLTVWSFCCGSIWTICESKQAKMTRQWTGQLTDRKNAARTSLTTISVLNPPRPIPHPAFWSTCIPNTDKNGTNQFDFSRCQEKLGLAHNTCCW